MDKNAGFQALTIVNDNISRRINVDKGCQQGNSISGCHLIFSFKILALQLKEVNI